MSVFFKASVLIFMQNILLSITLTIHISPLGFRTMFPADHWRISLAFQCVQNHTSICFCQKFPLFLSWEPYSWVASTFSKSPLTQHPSSWFSQQPISDLDLWAYVSSVCWLCISVSIPINFMTTWWVTPPEMGFFLFCFVFYHFGKALKDLKH